MERSSLARSNKITRCNLCNCAAKLCSARKSKQGLICCDNPPSRLDGKTPKSRTFANRIPDFIEWRLKISDVERLTAPGYSRKIQLHSGKFPRSRTLLPIGLYRMSDWMIEKRRFRLRTPMIGRKIRSSEWSGDPQCGCRAGDSY
jgi:hypothetical protein